MLLMLSAQAAVKLKNEDSRSYDLEVVQGSTTKHTLIQAGVTVPRQCSKAGGWLIYGSTSVEQPGSGTQWHLEEQQPQPMPATASTADVQ